jgi:cell division protein FtsZ
LDNDKSIKIRADLEEDNSETFDEEKKGDSDSDGISMKPIPQEIFDIPVISEQINIDELDIEKESEFISSDEINNLEVVYEILEFNSTEDQLLEFEEVSEVKDHDFIINNLSNDILDMEIVDELVISADEDSENQFTFDFALTNKNQNEIDVEKVIDKFDDIENPVEDKAINEAMDFKFEIVEKSEKSELSDLSIENENLKPESPFDKSIQESVTSENEKRKDHLKKFNHSFKHSLSKIDEFEKQPAYKRMGLDLEQHSSSDSDESRISLDKDKNDDIQLRTNNSFLHDNVD